MGRKIKARSQANGKHMRKSEVHVAAEVMVVAEEAKMDAYLARVAKLPKRDRRELSRASAQTKFIIDGMGEWAAYYLQYLGAIGLPRENVLYRAGLMLPRAPLGSVVLMADPSELAAAFEAGLRLVKPSRSRVLIRNEELGHKGLETVAHDLGMSLPATSRYLNEARQMLADVLRGMGWKVPLDG